jgi:hypothetical protein
VGRMAVQGYAPALEDFQEKPSNRPAGKGPRPRLNGRRKGAARA